MNHRNQPTKEKRKIQQNVVEDITKSKELMINNMHDSKYFKFYSYVK